MLVFAKRRRHVRDLPRKRTLLVDVAALDGGFGRLEAQPDVFVPAAAAFADALAPRGFAAFFVVGEDVRLFLEGALGLDGQFGRHGCRRECVGWRWERRVEDGGFCVPRLVVMCADLWRFGET